VTPLLSGFFIMLYFINPHNDLFSCRFKNLTGLECPTCGMTRALHETARMNILDGFGYHLFGPLLFVILFIMLFKYCFELFRNRIILINVSQGGLKFLLSGFALGWFFFWIYRLIV
jgi:hypothetical protein